MPHRTLLSPEQRTRLLGIPTEAAEMAKHYKRRPSNRLGFAVQLCALRHPSRPLEPSEVPPAAMLAFVANQVSADPKLFGDYAHGAETRREHLLELQQYLRLRSFRLAIGVLA
jgi:TnpA family transposase